MLCQLLDGIAALFHEPSRGGGGSTDADALDAIEPGGLYFVGILDEVGVGIDTQALVVEDLSVGTLTATDEKDEVMAGSKLRDVRHAVGYAAADGIETLEDGLRRDVRLDVFDDAVILVERFRGLRVEVDVSGKVEPFHLIEVLYDDGVRLCLPDESEHLSVTALAEDDDLRSPRLIILFLDTLLELEHHGASGIDDLDMVAAGEFVGLRGLAMGAQQHLHIVEFAQVVVIDGDKPQVLQPFTLHAVVDDISQAIEGLIACAKFFFGFLYGGGHTKAEATAVVDFDFHFLFVFLFIVYGL